MAFQTGVGAFTEVMTGRDEPIDRHFLVRVDIAVAVAADKPCIDVRFVGEVIQLVFVAVRALGNLVTKPQPVLMGIVAAGALEALIIVQAGPELGKGDGVAVLADRIGFIQVDRCVGVVGRDLAMTGHTADALRLIRAGCRTEVGGMALQTVGVLVGRFPRLLELGVGERITVRAVLPGIQDIAVTAGALLRRIVVTLLKRLGGRLLGLRRGGVQAV